MQISNEFQEKKEAKRSLWKTKSHNPGTAMPICNVKKKIIKPKIKDNYTLNTFNKIISSGNKLLVLKNIKNWK